MMTVFCLALIAAVAYVAYRRWRGIQQRKARLILNAALEHTRILRGDPRGYYGQFPPAVIPPILADDNKWHIT